MEARLSELLKQTNLSFYEKLQVEKEIEYLQRWINSKK